MQERRPEIFCPQGHLIWDKLECPVCHYHREYNQIGVGQIKWPQKLPDKVSKGHAKIVGVGDLIVIALAKSGLMCLDSRTGKKQWEQPLVIIPKSKISGLAAWNNYLVCTLAPEFGVGSARQKLLIGIVDVQNRRLVWKHDVTGSSVSAPVVDNDIVYYVAAQGSASYLYAVDLTAQSVRGRQKIATFQAPAPTIMSDKVWVGLNTPRLLGYPKADAADWNAKLEPQHRHIGENAEFTAYGQHNDMIVLSNNCALRQLDLHQDQVLDNWCDVVSYTSDPTVYQNGVYIGAEDDVRGDYCLIKYEISEQGFRRMYKFRLQSKLVHQPVAHDDVVMVVAEDGDFIIIDAAENKLRMKQTTSKRYYIKPWVYRDSIILVDRYGNIEARYWRQPTSLDQTAEEYEALEKWRDAGLAYALNGQLGKAAEMYMHAKMWRKAATLYTEAGDFENAARMYEKRKDYIKALFSWEKAGNKQGLAIVHELLAQKSMKKTEQQRNHYRKAGVAWQELGNNVRAAECYLKGGFYALALPLVTNTEDAERIRQMMPRGHAKAYAYEQAGQYAAAAQIWESLKEWALAATDWEQADQYAQAARIYFEQKRWRALSALKDNPDVNHGWVAYALENLAFDGDASYADVAEQYMKAAQVNAHSGQRECKMWEDALRCARKADDDELVEQCLNGQYQCNRWPNLNIESLESVTPIRGGESVWLKLKIKNNGYGNAYNIDLSFGGPVKSDEVKTYDASEGVGFLSPMPERVSADKVTYLQSNVHFPAQINGRRNAGSDVLSIQMRYCDNTGKEFLWAADASIHVTGLEETHIHNEAGGVIHLAPTYETRSTTINTKVTVGNRASVETSNDTTSTKGYAPDEITENGTVMQNPLPEVATRASRFGTNVELGGVSSEPLVEDPEPDKPDENPVRYVDYLDPQTNTRLYIPEHLAKELMSRRKPDLNRVLNGDHGQTDANFASEPQVVELKKTGNVRCSCGRMYSYWRNHDLTQCPRCGAPWRWVD